MGHSAAVEGRIELIADMMRDLSFRSGKTVKKLAAEWGLSRATVSEYAAEASKRVLAEWRDVEHTRVTVGVALEKVIEGAMADLDDPPMVVDPSGARAWPESPNKTRMSIIAAADKLAEIMGSKAAQRLQVDAKVGVSLDEIDVALASAAKNETTGSDDGSGEGEPG